VHLGLREVDEAAGVVEVEMRHDDVAHIGRFQAQRLQAADHRPLGVEARPQHRRVPPGQARVGAQHVPQPAPSVHQDDAVPRRLDGEAVAR
jgi:hypothetical protein